MIIETLGCVTVQIDNIGGSFLCARPIGSNEINLNVNNIDPVININTVLISNPIEVTCGLICGSSVGLPVLYASDGVLITINGLYLIVQKEN